MKVIRPEWSAPSHVKVLCTTRDGGVSASPYDSMNLGLHVGDDVGAVEKNRQRLKEIMMLPAPPVWLRQVHGTDIFRAGEVRIDEPADGAWTDKSDQVLAVMTADCLPVVLTDASGERVAVVHAGWRGLAAGILAEAVATFTGLRPGYAWLGPAIGPAAFEVGGEVREVFVERRSSFDQAFTKTNVPGKYLADLYSLARIEITALGDIECSGGDWCTFTDAARFHSHRRDGARSGRMATIAWLG